MNTEELKELVRLLKLEITINAINGITMDIDDMIDYGGTLCDENESMDRLVNELKRKIAQTESLEEIIRKAFKKGEQWGVAYSTWFTPTEEQKEEQIWLTIKEIIG